MQIILILLTLWIVIVSSSTLGPVIETTSGAVKGRLVNFEGSFYYYAYKGIPYAESPIGDLRYMPPVPKQPWKGIRDATEFGPVCPQVEGKYKRHQMSEDCLFLNIFVPVSNTSEPKAALLFIHGGAFHCISGNSDVIYGSELLLTKDIIVVTINFRQGVLGFLTLDIEEASGNAGMKDIVLSLKWLQHNIKRFGGDPQRITIGGHSSGAAAVHFLMLSQKAVGLFQRAILISGSAFSYRFLMNHKVDIMQAYIKKLGLVTQNKYELLEQLKKRDPFELIKASFDILKDQRNELEPRGLFVPSVEMDYPGAFLTKTPKQVMQHGIPHNVSILVGINAQESCYIYRLGNGDEVINKVSNNLELLVPADIEYPFGSEESLNLTKSIIKFYFGNDSLIPLGSTPQSTEAIIDVLSDIQYNYYVDSWIKLFKEKCVNSALYYYLFDFDGELNWARLNYGASRRGTWHADELGYIFVTRSTANILGRVSARTKTMMEIMLATFTDFVKYGNPTPEGSRFRWPECGKKRSHFVLSDQSGPRPDPPYESRMQFWYDVYDQYKIYLENGGRTVRKYIPS